MAERMPLGDDDCGDREALQRRITVLDQSLEHALVAAEDAQEEARLLAEDRIRLEQDLTDQRHQIAELHSRLARLETENSDLRQKLVRTDLRLRSLTHSEGHLSEELQASYEELQVLAAQLEEANADLEQRVEQRTRQLVESEMRYRTLFEAMDEGFYLAEVIFLPGGRPVDILYLEENPAAVRMVGQSFAGRRLREIDASYEPYWYEIFGRVALTGEPERMELYAGPLKVWFNFYVFRVGGPKSRRVAVVFEDVTERKHAQRALAESERLLREALTIGEMAAWTWDPDSGDATASDSVTEVFGLRPGDSFQDCVMDFRLVHPEDVRRVRAVAEDACARGQSWHTEFRIIRPRDGRIAWLEERASVAPDPATGKPRRVGLV